MTVISLLLCTLFVIWLTYALMPESRKEWVLIPVGLLLSLVAISIVVVEALLSWLLMSAITQRPVECAVGVITIHLLIGIAIWRSQ